MANQPTRSDQENPPSEIKGQKKGLIKGNQWLVNLDRKAG